MQAAINYYFKLLERSIVLGLELNDLDDVIFTCKKALSFLAEKNISIHLYKIQFAMIYSNMGIAYSYKFQDENLPENKEFFYNQAIKFMNKGRKLFYEQEDICNYVATSVQLSKLKLMFDGNIGTWIRTNKRLAKKIQTNISSEAQHIYAEILLSIVHEYCASSAFYDFGMSYKTAKKCLEEVQAIYKKIHSNNPIYNFELSYVYLILETTCASDISTLENIIVELEKLLVEYKKHIEKDFCEGLFEKYANNIQNSLGVLNYEIGTHYDEINDFESAIIYYNKSIQYYIDAANSLKKIGCQGSVEAHNIYHNIAVVRCSIYKFEKQNNPIIFQNINKLENTINAFMQVMSNHISMADIFLDLGMSHYLEKNYGTALRCYQDAEQILDGNCDQNNNFEMIYLICKNYADLFEAIGDFNQSKYYIEKARKILLNSGYEKNSEEIYVLDQKLEMLTTYKNENNTQKSELD